MDSRTHLFCRIYFEVLSRIHKRLDKKKIVNIQREREKSGILNDNRFLKNMAAHDAKLKSLFVTSNAKVEDQKEGTSTRMLLLNAVAEVKNKNNRKAIVEFNQSYNETNANDDMFLSKLLELNFQDLEMLFQCLCGSEKNRRSSKQHEKKNSFKKKTSVGDCSFANAAFDGELKCSNSSSSLGRKRSLNEENIQGKSCLRKAYCLQRDLTKTETHDEAFHHSMSVHLKVENYYSCVVLCVENKDKTSIEKFICTLDDPQRLKMSQICLFIAAKETHPGSNSGNNFKSRIEYCKLASKLQPNALKPTEVLCRLYRCNDETEKAFAAAKIYLEEVNSEEESIIVLQVMCLIDTDKIVVAKTHVESILKNESEQKQLMIILGLLHILNHSTKHGVDIIISVNVTDNKTLLVTIMELLNISNLQKIVRDLITHVHRRKDELKKQHPEDKEQSKILQEEKLILILAGQLLAFKSPNDLDIAKLYIDCLFTCEEIDVAQSYLVKLVKEHPTETLPMIFLANIRLKLGAYIASTEDFRTLLKLSGEKQLESDLLKLSVEDRNEIARVHRLHGFRFLGKDIAFKEASECFTVALCALGPSAVGLLLSRGYCYMHLNAFEAAALDFHNCLQRNNLLTSALCARAVLNAVTTHVEEALADFRKAFSIDFQSCQQCLPKLPLEHVLTFSQMLIQYVKQGLENVAPPKKQYAINELNNLEYNNEDHKELDIEVVNYSEFLCNVFPNNIDYLSTFIECLHHKPDKWILIRSVIDRAVTNFPGEPSFQAWKAVLLSEHKQFEEAIAQLKEIAQSETDVSKILSYLTPRLRNQLFEKASRKARRAADKNNYGESLKYYDIAVMLNSDNVDSLRGRADCYYKLDEMNKWLKDISKILELNPKSNDYRFRAQYYQNEGEDLKACEDYMTSLDMNESETIESVTINSNGDDIVKMFYNAASRMVDLGKTRNILMLCEAGLKFDPHHKGLKQLRERSTVNKCSIQ